MIFVNSALQAAIRLSAPAKVSRLRHGRPRAHDAAEAVTWHQRVLAERGGELPPGHPAVIAARVSLARALIVAGQPAAAVTVLERAAGDCEQSRGPGHPDTLGVTEDLAAAYQAAGEPAAATRLLTRTLADRERLQGPRDAQTVATRDPRGRGLPGKTKGAISHYKRVLADRESVLGRGHPDSIASRAGLAAAYYRPGGCRPRWSSPSSAARTRRRSSAPITRTR